MIRQLRLVEIELFSHCNRTCLWCSNSFVDRHKHNIEIDDDILYDLLFDLKSHGYTGPITFSRYNEPLSRHKILKKRIAQIKHVLPNNKLITNTNGDFLKREVLDDLEIDELTIMDYDGLGLDKCVNRLVSVGAEIDKIDYPYIHAHRGKMQMLYVVDWKDTRKITDRCGLLPQFQEGFAKIPALSPHISWGSTTMARSPLAVTFAAMWRAIRTIFLRTSSTKNSPPSSKTQRP